MNDLNDVMVSVYSYIKENLERWSQKQSCNIHHHKNDLKEC